MEKGKSEGKRGKRESERAKGKWGRAKEKGEEGREKEEDEQFDKKQYQKGFKKSLRMDLEVDLFRAPTRTIILLKPKKFIFFEVGAGFRNMFSSRGFRGNMILKGGGAKI